QRLLAKLVMDFRYNDFGHCHARLPNAGLGNKLFVWARAHMFARLNNLPLVVSGWTKIQKAPLLHGGDVRLYLNYFRTVREVGFLKRSRIYRKAEVVRDPPVGITAPCTHYTVYEFSNVPHWADYF